MSDATEFGRATAKAKAKISALARGDLLERCRRSLNLGRYLSAGAWRPELREIDDETGVALTFDDGPTPETTPALLKLLETYGAKATFFVCGVRASAHFDLVEAIVRAGHAVYGHGWEHVHYDEHSPDLLVESVARCEALLARARPTPSPYFVRLPYTAGHRSAACHRALARWRPDIQFVHYSAVFNDWLLVENCASREEARARVADTLARTPTARLARKIVLLHERHFDDLGRETNLDYDVEATLDLVEGLLQRLARQGLETRRLEPVQTPAKLAKFFLPPRLGMLRVSLP